MVYVLSLIICAPNLQAQAAADKIVREIELFGDDFENFGKEEDEPEVSSTSKGTTAGKATKGKLQAKSTGHTYQFQIMESIGVPRSEVKKFADPHYWLEYFPPIAVVSLASSMRLNSDPTTCM